MPDRPPYGFLEAELIAIWESVLDQSGVGVGDDFFALGGDSILGAEAVARIRDLTGERDLPLVSIVRAPTPAAMAREVLTDIGRGQSGAVPLQESGNRTPIFFVHPGDGDVLAYAQLARRLGADQPSYALRARGIDDGRPLQGSLEEMASDYVDEIRQVQPHGPYIVGGFCVGGPIAFEMARQLDAAREQVASILLLDPKFRSAMGASLRRVARAASSSRPAACRRACAPRRQDARLSGGRPARQGRRAILLSEAGADQGELSASPARPAYERAHLIRVRRFRRCRCGTCARSSGAR